MFSVLFEVNPASDKYGDYLNNAKMLRPELEKIDGFVENIRYKSLRRQGWILSLSSWRDEKAVVRWRISANHHNVQQQGRDGILSDYHLRVGEYMADSQLPEGMELKTQRTDETVVGEGKMVTLITATRPSGHPENETAYAQFMGLDIYAGNILVDWDIYEAVNTPGDLTLMLVWENCNALEYFASDERMILPDSHRIRHVRVIRDYAKFDRREAPQYYPDAPGRETIHT